MNGSIRTEKVAQTIRETLMNVLLRDVSDPRLSDVMVTDVKVSKDLHLAWVYYDTRDGASLEEKKQKEIEKGLKSATSFFGEKSAKQWPQSLPLIFVLKETLMVGK